MHRGAECQASSCPCIEGFLRTISTDLPATLATIGGTHALKVTLDNSLQLWLECDRNPGILKQMLTARPFQSRKTHRELAVKQLPSAGDYTAMRLQRLGDPTIGGVIPDPDAAVHGIRRTRDSIDGRGPAFSHQARFGTWRPMFSRAEVPGNRRRRLGWPLGSA
jgi:hypothetical protein